MLRRVLWLFVAFPVAAVLVTLAVANRHPVRLVLDPFRPETPVLSLELPFYAYLFIVLMTGVILGGDCDMGNAEQVAPDGSLSCAGGDAMAGRG